MRAELDHVAGSSAAHALPFDLPYSLFTVDALSTFLLPVVFVPLQAAACAARLLLRKGGGLSDDDESDEGGADEHDSIVVLLSGKGCRGLLSISRASDASGTQSRDVEHGGEQHISVKNRVGMPLPFVVSQSGTGTVLPRNGFIPAYGSVTLVASGGGGRGCGASVCVVHELLEQSFKSALLA